MDWNNPNSDPLKDIQDAWHNLLNAETPEVRIEAAGYLLDFLSPPKPSEGG